MVNGKLGWKWGDKGKCYTGKNADKMVDAQRKAIEWSKHNKGK